MLKPNNHVTRAMAQALSGTAPEPTLPEVPKALLEALQARYVPRCLQPGEDHEFHLAYAGKVELVAMLARAFEEQQQIGVDPEDDFNLSTAERIT